MYMSSAYLAYNDNSTRRHQFYISRFEQRHMLNRHPRYTYRCAPDSVDSSSDCYNASMLAADNGWCDWLPAVVL